MDGCVIRVTVRRSLYDVVRNDNQVPRSLCAVYFQPVPRRHEIDLLSYPMALKFDQWIGNIAAQPPVIFQSIWGYFKTQSLKLKVCQYK